MAQALNAGATTRRRRAFFGLLDADGWGWASVKAFFWFIVIIFMLGYIPDRAYYFTVNRTIDLGILAWSPVNLCPATNVTLPCPAPAGSVLPWEEAPAVLALPEPRTDGALLQAGTKLLYIGGSDGSKASNKVSVAEIVQVGNFDKWKDGPALPAPRADAAVAFLGGSIYVSGGTDENGAPAKDTYILTPNLQTGDLGEWKTASDAEEKIDLPEARTGAALVPLADGLLLVGGADAQGAPTKTTWKSKLDSQGKLGEWTPQAPLVEPVTDAVSVLNGDFVWVYGGRSTNGATATVQRGSIATSGEQLGQVTQFAAGGPSLPAPRANATGWAVNGALYLVGGTDGSTTHGELYWAIPAKGASGDEIPEWKSLPQSNLPAAGLQGGAAALVGPNVIITGGKSGDAVQATSARANLAPQEPFFQLGLVGATVPALKVEGEIGQQLGYLNAAGAGTVNFIVLLLIGWAFAHKERTRELFGRLRRRRGR